jgi:hypothetical protein
MGKKSASLKIRRSKSPTLKIRRSKSPTLKIRRSKTPRSPNKTVKVRSSGAWGTIIIIIIIIILIVWAITSFNLE